MTRIDDLHKKYPTFPLEVIVRLEIVNRGVRDTDDLDKVSEWKAATQSYQSKFDDVTLKELAEKRPSRLRDGRMLRPNALLMKNGLAAAIRINPKSPYEIREVSEGKFALCEGEETVNMEVYFPQAEQREGPEPLTSRGTPISRLVSSPRNCFMIFPVRFCEYFTSGDQCKFCNFNSGQEDARSVGLDRPVAENLDDTVEAYKIRSSEVRLVEGRFELGGYMNAENEERIHCRFVEKIANAAPYKPNFTIHT
ncbi:MAG: hypothetical protein Q7O66_00990, partial [Dehalococcoidia bacterium]|nr:hypothetical protein [Dehalococcoidia bacterium]